MVSGIIEVAMHKRTLLVSFYYGAITQRLAIQKVTKAEYILGAAPHKRTQLVDMVWWRVDSGTSSGILVAASHK